VSEATTGPRVSGDSRGRAAPPLPPALAWLDELPFFQAGLQGYSDAPMRIIARRHGCPYAVTESTLDRFLINGGKGLRNAELDDEDHPIAGQIIGYYPDDMARAAEILIELGYDVVDINLACPVKKIRHEPRGGHLLEDGRQAVRIIREVRRVVGDRVPLTVKLRRAYDDDSGASEVFRRVFDAVVEAGFAAATVHGRTVAQKYAGPSRWSFLRELVAAYPGFTILGSGDIFTPEAIFAMLRETGVRGVSVARGAIGNPWIFRQAARLLRGETPRPPAIAEQRDVLADHFRLCLARGGEEATSRAMRKFGIKFSHHHPRAAEVARAFIATCDSDAWWEVLERFYPPCEGGLPAGRQADAPPHRPHGLAGGGGLPAGRQADPPPPQRLMGAERLRRKLLGP